MQTADHQGTNEEVAQRPAPRSPGAVREPTARRQHAAGSARAAGQQAEEERGEQEG